MYRIIYFLAGLLIVVGNAWAHAFLRNANPPVGATVQTAPRQLVIDYTEAIEPRFSTVEVQDALGARMDEGPVAAAPGDDKRLVVGLKTLMAGSFKVTWHVTSKDTHKTEGSYTFIVRP